MSTTSSGRGGGLGVGGELAADRAPRLGGARHAGDDRLRQHERGRAAVPGPARAAHRGGRPGQRGVRLHGGPHRPGRRGGRLRAVADRLHRRAVSYELHVPAAYGLHVWETLLDRGADLGAAPFGVEAQRILRLEKGHLIVGQDTDGLTRGFSAGLDWAIKLDKDDFIGKPELAWQHARQRGATAAARGWSACSRRTARVVPPEASQIVDGPRIVGRITSSRMSPTLGRSVCLAQVGRAAVRTGHPGHGAAAGRPADRRPGDRAPRPRGSRREPDACLTTLWWPGARSPPLPPVRVVDGLGGERRAGAPHRLPSPTAPRWPRCTCGRRGTVPWPRRWVSRSAGPAGTTVG